MSVELHRTTVNIATRSWVVLRFPEWSTLQRWLGSIVGLNTKRHYHIGLPAMLCFFQRNIFSYIISPCKTKLKLICVSCYWCFQLTCVLLFCYHLSHFTGLQNIHWPWFQATFDHSCLLILSVNEKLGLSRYQASTCNFVCTLLNANCPSSGSLSCLLNSRVDLVFLNIS